MTSASHRFFFAMRQPGAIGRALTFACLAVLVALSFGLLAAKPAHAKTFTVNSPEDFSDINPGDGTCDASSTFLIPCTLRAAIEEANAFAGQDTVNFNIPVNAVKTIKPSKELPTIYDQVTINGYTQPGASPNTSANSDNAVLKIELDGTNAGGDANGISLGAGSSNSVVKGLVINRFKGYSGVSPSSGTKVQGNFIGTKKNGTGALGNGNHGVAIATSNHTVGGDEAAAANVIAYNDSDGVRVFVCGTCTVFPTGNRILRNSIHSNDVLGIDLVGGTESISGFTFNDPGDTDNGPNRLQNYPELTSATTSGGTTTIKGKLNSTPNKTFTLQFFSDPDNPTEGEKYIGQKSVTTNANGNVSFTFNSPQAVAVLQLVTATATNPGGNTSELSVGEFVEQ